MAREDTLYTEADIIALKKKMKSALTEVGASDGKSAKFRELSDMRSLLRDMQREVYGLKRRAGVRAQEVVTSVGGDE